MKVESYRGQLRQSQLPTAGSPGKIRFQNSTLIEDSGLPDLEGPDAAEIPIHQLPLNVLPYLDEQPLL